MWKLALSGLVIVGLGLGLGACGPTYRMTDDIDLTWDFTLTLSRFDDDLHSPYVRGARVTLFAHSSDDGADFHGWSIASSDPAVFRVDDSAVETGGEGLVAHGQAVGEGTARLRLLDDRGHEVGGGVAEVRVPDRVELAAHGSLILGRDDEAAVSEARVVEGGEATYLVRYFRDGRELHGNGVLTADVAEGLPGVTAQPRTTFLFENREWLTLDAATVGTGTLQLRADQAAVASVPLVVVPEGAIEEVVVLTQPEKGHDDGDWLVALAQAYDAGGERIFGVDYAWNVDGVAQDGDGDLYRYRFRRGAFEMVEAQRGTHSDAAMIQADEGFVDSSNRIGCAAGGGGGSLLVGLAGLGLVAVGRRRRAPVGARVG
ncbi:MAG TPA: MYXO-CTERM sorting domain-containing protein [Kofleriaceae bacterium]|nr:MYXO-CTERM sorting domain-containing protein [Kofleriaceae bacterium]